MLLVVAIFFEHTEMLHFFFFLIDASPQLHGEDLRSTVTDVVIDGEIFRRNSLPPLCAPRRFFWSGRGKQVALLFELPLVSGVRFCHLRRSCCLVRAIIKDNGAEALISDGRSLLKNITEQLHWKLPAACPKELQFPS